MAIIDRNIIRCLLRTKGVFPTSYLIEYSIWAIQNIAIPTV